MKVGRLIFVLEVPIIAIQISWKLSVIVHIPPIDYGSNMPESRGKVRSKEILADIHAGMNESQLVEKYNLSPQQM